MKINQDELKGKGFALIVEVRHSDIVPFVNRCFRKSPMATGAFLFIMAVLVGVIVLVPVHEYLHVAAYRVLGAKSTKVICDFNKFLFWPLHRDLW